MGEEDLQRGQQCEAAGDLAGAEAAYREADALGDAEGAILLGLILQRRGALSEATDAFLRAETRGHREAGSCLGNLLADTGDIEGAKAAYQRSIAAGSSDAVLNLGLTLAQAGAADEALPYLRTAQDNGDPAAAWAVGKILEDKDDLKGAATAYRQGAVGGIPAAAYGLGVVLTKLDDRDGARAAFQRAKDLGDENAGHILEMLDTEEVARSSAEDSAKWAELYVAACAEVLADANACMEVANRAVGAREMAAERPQHEISIRNFTKVAEEAEIEFVPLYQAFAGRVSTARGIAANLLSTQPDPLDAELALAVSAGGDDVLNQVSTVKSLMMANYGPTPAAFIQGVEEANQLMQIPSDGNIYRPPVAATSDERLCPWCAETIKSAAIICRFCGRDLESAPSPE